MTLTTVQKHKLKKFVKELELHRGRHTELVSVYIPKGYDINKVINHLSQEQGTASNIKSASTRKNVVDALERMIQHLRLFKRTPENGLAAFSGNIASKEGQQDLKVWSIEPPVPLKTRIYRCDKEFVLDLLRDMMEVKEIYALVIVDRRDANIAYLKGKTIVPVLKSHSQVPGKIKAGGQSAARYARIREGAIKDHYKKVADHMKNEFLGKKELKGIIMGGPGPSKHDLIDGDFITTELKKKIIAIKDISYTGEFGLQELLDKSKDVLAKEEVMAEKDIMSKFFELLSKKPGMVSYGEKEVAKSLKNGAVETLLLSEDLDDKEIDKLEEEAKQVGSEVKIISTETREGAQLRDMGKVAAILRYDTG
ncbi:peptide chain release factor 1 [Candidatus Woesearchaeota archaeon]|nr:peptide chain release factor 1 [Candidatus Woesearchaeota archaeon]|tara:strand:+ start:6812 stop:7909 length:1098 start_codon:yes stop_codon:yes gene_type:complete